MLKRIGGSSMNPAGTFNPCLMSTQIGSHASCSASLATRCSAGCQTGDTRVASSVSTPLPRGSGLVAELWSLISAAVLTRHRYLHLRRCFRLGDVPQPVDYPRWRCFQTCRSPLEGPKRLSHQLTQRHPRGVHHYRLKLYSEPVGVASDGPPKRLER